MRTLLALCGSMLAVPHAKAIEPTRAPEPERVSPARLKFVADPIGDGAVLSFSVGVALLSDAIIGTGEIAPQQPQEASRLLAIDRSVVDHEPIPEWATLSNVGVSGAVLFGAIDPVLSLFRYGWHAAIIDAIIYAETFSITASVTNLTKISFRRPRPSAYREQQRLYEIYGKDNAPAITQTNSALSFFSGHASATASMAATATYLAFARAPGTPRAWLTLSVGGVTTVLVCIGRVESGKHFPTDVIAGALAGAAIGIMVPHLHRADPPEERRVWFALAPIQDGIGISATYNE